MSKMATLSALVDSDRPQRLQAMADYKTLTEQLRQTTATLEATRLMLDQAAICLSREMSMATATGEKLTGSLVQSVERLEGFPKALAEQIDKARTEGRGQIEDMKRLVEYFQGFPEAFREALEMAEREAAAARADGKRQIENLLQTQRSSLESLGPNIERMAGGAIERPLASLQAQVTALAKAAQVLDTLPGRTQAQADRVEMAALRTESALKEIPGFWGLAVLMSLSGLTGGVIVAVAILFLARTGVLDLSAPSPPQAQAQEQPAPPPADSPPPKSKRPAK